MRGSPPKVRSRRARAHRRRAVPVPVPGGVTVEPFDTCSDVYVAALRGDWRRASALCRDPYDRAGGLGVAERRWRRCRCSTSWTGRAGAAAAARARRTADPRGAQATTRSNPAGLTQRQLDVLALIAEDHQRAEIAERLVVSVRTVDHHVGDPEQARGALPAGAAATADSLGLVAHPA